jgi:multiple sugar transport system permease protein
MAWALLLIIACFTALIFRSSSYWVHYETETEERR